MTWTTLALVSLALQDDKVDSYYKFPAGTSWTLKEEDHKDGDKAAMRIVMTVTKDEGGKISVESKEFHEDPEKPRLEALVWEVQDGILTWSEVKGDKAKPVMRLFKVGSKKDDTWDASGSESDKIEATHMGTEEVKVPAGTYQAVHVKMTMKERGISIHVFLAPKVGLIKLQRELGGKSTSIVMTEFKEAK